MDVGLAPPLDKADSARGREFCRWLFTRVMERVDVTASMHKTMVLVGQELHVGPHVFDLGRLRQVIIVAIGKAAVPMARHVYQTLHSAIPLRGVVVGTGEWEARPGLEYLRGDHPVPYAASFAAAQACLRLVSGANGETLVIHLISGGASALAEAPLDPSIPGEDIAIFYRQILYSGLPIGPANALRKHFSAIKGGRLALAAGKATHCTLLVSDVPAGRFDVVGSGPSLADTSTVKECRQLLAETSAFQDLPVSLQRFAATMPETPKRLPAGTFPSACVSVLSSDSLIDAALPLLHAAGFHAMVDNTCDDWDYREAAKYLVDRASVEAAPGRPIAIISAGEVTIAIEGKAGMGGRNQQWALEVARLIEGDDRLVAISVGSDGIDGNSPAAGAIVDGATWHRASVGGLDPGRALAGFNAYPIFAALSDAVTPGPSGNNLRDLRIIFGNMTIRSN